MRKQVLLILLFLVGVSMIGGGKIYAAEWGQETSIHFQNTYIPEPDEEDEKLIPGTSTRPEVPGQNQKFPQTGEKGLDKRIFSLGIVLLCLGTISIVIKMSVRIFYKKMNNEEERTNMKISKLALVGILSTSILAGVAPIVQAADGGSTDTVGDIMFTADDGPGTGPIDPENPDIDLPLVPDEPGGGTEGPLRIDYVSHFHFGEQEMSGATAVYNAELSGFTDSEGDPVKRQNFVQVTDNRGTNVGWKLQVQQNDQFSTADADELKGAALSMKNLTVVGVLGTDIAPPTAKPTVNLVAGTWDDADEEYTAGALQDVVSAKVDEGMSTWITSFGNKDTGAESVQLTVPSGSKKQIDEKYTTNLTWVLSDTPA